jgi:hypothetical protein
MAVRNYFSGVENNAHYGAATNAGAKHVLMSFLYIEKKAANVIAARKKANPKVRFMIDSGAHTFEDNWNNTKMPYHAWKVADYEAYLKRYLEWLKRNANNIECAAELDIDWPLVVATYGMQTVQNGKYHEKEDGKRIVQEWQEKYFKPLEKNYGINIIYVWHNIFKMDGFEEMCKKFAYVGIPGEKSSDTDFNKYITIARRYCTKLHGFAATKQSDFRDWPWYSIDSTTWKSSEIYGTLIDWDNHSQKLTFEEDKSKRQNYRQKFISLGFNPDDIILDRNYKEVTRYALLSMANMEEFYRKKYATRTFYYEMRLPHPSRIAQAKVSGKFLLKRWEAMRPDENFKNHASLPLRELQTVMTALAAVQYREMSYLSAASKEVTFLADYFPNFVEVATGVKDLDALQKELANHITPKNEIALPRYEREHWIPTNNVAKVRPPAEIQDSDLEHEHEKYFHLIEDET